MNIFYIGSPQLFGEGASSIHVARMCEAFAEHGHKCRAYSSYRD